MNATIGEQHGNASVMTVQACQTPSPQKMPPSERDFGVYELVAVRCQTTREAATMCGISQTRVRQIVAKVTEFLSEAIPDECEALSLERRMIAGERLASMRLDFLYCQALAMWRASQADGKPARVSYLGAATRIAVAAAKLPLLPLPKLAEENAAEETASGTKSAPTTSDHSTGVPTTSLVGDCSKPAASSSPTDQRLASPIIVTLSPDEPCKVQSDRQEAANRDFLRPAQRSERASLEPLARGETQSKLTESS